MRETQLAAYRTLGNLPEKRRKVAKAVGNGATLYELTKILGWPVNRVSGRVTELVEAGVVEDSGEKRINPESNKANIVWRLVGIEPVKPQPVKRAAPKTQGRQLGLFG